MSRSTLRCALRAGALCLTATTTAAVVPAAADAAEVGVSAKRLNIQTGSRVTVKGRTAAPGVAKLQIQRRGRWVTLDRDRTDAAGRFVLRKRVQRRAERARSCAPEHRRDALVRPAERLPPRTRLVVRAGPVRQPAGLRRNAQDRLARRRQQVAAVRHEGHVPPPRDASCASRVIDRGPVRRRARVRPHRRDRAQARLQRPRADPGHQVARIREAISTSERTGRQRDRLRPGPPLV